MRLPTHGSFLLFVVACLVCLQGCADLADRTRTMAQRGGLSEGFIEGRGFTHEYYATQREPTNVLYVFIEGDGRPWRHGGKVIADDPTPRIPLALELALRTPHNVLYLGRPCYLYARADSRCTPAVWTSARYSRAVVGSMVAALNRFAEARGYRRLVLIGYSGGGTLAVLMAPSLPATTVVVTIAANLDVGAWVRWHRYLPLDSSLNPASEPALPSTIAQLHLLGERDKNVPPALSQRFLDQVSSDRIWRWDSFDHVCCWVQQWDIIRRRIDDDAKLNDRF